MRLQQIGRYYRKSETPNHERHNLIHPCVKRRFERVYLNRFPIQLLQLYKERIDASFENFNSFLGCKREGTFGCDIPDQTATFV